VICGCVSILDTRYTRFNLPSLHSVTTSALLVKSSLAERKTVAEPWPNRVGIKKKVVFPSTQPKPGKGGDLKQNFPAYFPLSTLSFGCHVHFSRDHWGPDHSLHTVEQRSVVRIRSRVDNAVVHPMSGTGFPFSLPIHLLFHICNHLRLLVRVGFGGCGLLAPITRTLFSQFHHPGKSTFLYLRLSMAVGLFE
jgi:hypothetical protein